MCTNCYIGVVWVLGDKAVEYGIVGGGGRMVYLEHVLGRLYSVFIADRWL